MSTAIPRREAMLLVASAALAHAAVPRAPASDGTQALPPAAIAQTDGELVYVGRDPVRIKISPANRGRFAMITQDVSPGTSIPVHLHENEDEIIFIQSGQGEAVLGDERIALSAGSTLYVPQGTWHGGRNSGTEILRWIAIYSPSGFEGYFREIGRRSPDDPPRALNPEAREARDSRYGIRYRL
jgi:mannose-6-phosphate isomerase-like protein (cupin superfamily)